MFDKLKAMLAIYTQGSSVVDALYLKKKQLTANMLSGLLIAVVSGLKAYNVDLHVTDAQLVQLAGALFTVISLYNAHATVASTDKFGLSAKSAKVALQETGTETAAVVDQPAESGVQPVADASSESGPQPTIAVHYAGVSDNPYYG